jgi:fatty-acyl-CoA synthase
MLADASINRAAPAPADFGIARGERVALLSHNNDAYVVLYLALARLGAISVPINFMLNAAEVAYILGHCAASGLIVEEWLLPVDTEALRLGGAPPALRGLGYLDRGRDRGRGAASVQGVRGNAT